MTQMLVASSLLVGIVGLLWVVVLAIRQDNRCEHNKKVRTF
ncbi:MAG TPA: hypothetical protein VLD60_04735 [Nitrospira sp.]|nr:hypothetical protein [Nitrospira sp.]